MGFLILIVVLFLWWFLCWLFWDDLFLPIVGVIDDWLLIDKERWDTSGISTIIIITSEKCEKWNWKTIGSGWQNDCDFYEQDLHGQPWPWHWPKLKVPRTCLTKGLIYIALASGRATLAEALLLRMTSTRLWLNIVPPQSSGLQEWQAKLPM